MVAYGNLDRLDQDPAKYNAFISTKTKNGWVPDKEQDRYYVRTKQSPPARAYGPQVRLRPKRAGELLAFKWLRNSALSLTGFFE